MNMAWRAITGISAIVEFPYTWFAVVQGSMRHISGEKDEIPAPASMSDSDGDSSLVRLIGDSNDYSSLVQVLRKTEIPAPASFPAGALSQRFASPNSPPLSPADGRE